MVAEVDTEVVKCPGTQDDLVVVSRGMALQEIGSHGPVEIVERYGVHGPTGDVELDSGSGGDCCDRWVLLEPGDDGICGECERADLSVADPAVEVPGGQE